MSRPGLQVLELPVQIPCRHARKVRLIPHPVLGFLEVRREPGTAGRCKFVVIPTPFL